MTLKLNAPGGGSVTIDVPTTASNFTLTAPASTGNVVVSPQTVTVPNATGTVMVSGNMPAFSAYISSGTYTISTSTITLIPFNAKSGSPLGFDTNTCYNNTGSTVTLNGLSVPTYSFCPNVAGYYQINAMVGIWSGSSGVAYTKLYKNGTDIINGQVLAFPTTAKGISPVLATIVYLNGTGDYVQIYGIQTSGSTLNIDTLSWSYFSASMVRAA